MNENAYPFKTVPGFRCQKLGSFSFTFKSDFFPTEIKSGKDKCMLIFDGFKYIFIKCLILMHNT